MAELIYDERGRLLFTEEMKREYTLLMPQMLPVHFTMLKRVFELEGYTVDMLTTNHRGIVDTGLKYVHNDTCYPALLVIGQLLDAVKSGKYDTHKIGLLITQTGGGCRASNYIHLLRKALHPRGIRLYPRRVGQPVRPREEPRLFPRPRHDHAHGLFDAVRGSHRPYGQPVPPL